VLFVSWQDAKAFCRWLSENENVPYRLPTEAEWEYACRAGSQMAFYWGDAPEPAGQYANISDRAAKSEWPSWNVAETDDGQPVSTLVGNYLPNAFGLYDMIGNAWEWCEDWYAADYYKALVSVDPPGPKTGGIKRVVRGGAWSTSPWYWGSANRRATPGTEKNDSTGFRVVVPLEGK